MKYLPLNIFLLLVWLAPGPIYADAVPLVPHSARYQLTPEEIRIPGINQFEGEMLTRMERGCDSWTLFSRTDILLGGPGQPPIHSQSFSVAQESLDGTRLTFRTQTLVNGQVVEEVAGTASDGEIRFTIPKDKTVALDANVLFPMSAFRNLMAGVARGQKFQSYSMFMGDSLEPLRLTEVMLPQKDLGLKRPQGHPHLLDGPSARLLSSFFKLEETDQEPTRTHETIVHENGVAAWMLIDQAEMKISGNLVQVEEIETPACDG